MAHRHYDRPGSSRIVRLLDGTEATIQAVIDNFSRWILAFRVSDSFGNGNSIAVLVEAAAGIAREDFGEGPPMPVVDGGSNGLSSRPEAGRS